MPGLTLIELMTVVAIVAILGTLAAPSLRDFLIRNRTAAISNELVASVLRSRSEAVTRNSCVTLCRSTLGSSPPMCAANGADWRGGWIAFVNPTCSDTANTPAQDDIFVAAGPFDASFKLISNATNTDRVVFSPTGNARAGDAGRFDLQYLSETRASNRSICLSALGRTRLIAFGGTC